jgi:hypothetical protein
VFNDERSSSGAPLRCKGEQKDQGEGTEQHAAL